jgi:hypothetical protein
MDAEPDPTTEEIATQYATLLNADLQRRTARIAAAYKDEQLNAIWAAVVTHHPVAGWGAYRGADGLVALVRDLPDRMWVRANTMGRWEELTGRGPDDA